MKFVVDMNRSPAWVEAFAQEGFDAVHWSMVGDPRASDAIVMEWSGAAERVVVTNDLDFGALLAASRGSGPSVLQVRTQDVSPAALGPKLFAAIREHGSWREAGALVTLDEARARARVLPIRR